MHTTLTNHRENKNKRKVKPSTNEHTKNIEYNSQCFLSSPSNVLNSVKWQIDLKINARVCVLPFEIHFFSFNKLWLEDSSRDISIIFFLYAWHTFAVQSLYQLTLFSFSFAYHSIYIYFSGGCVVLTVSLVRSSFRLDFTVSTLSKPTMVEPLRMKMRIPIVRT